MIMSTERRCGKEVIKIEDWSPVQHQMRSCKLMKNHSGSNAKVDSCTKAVIPKMLLPIRVRLNST